ncbi:Vegetative incompatibility protein HET-E-1 [Fulvia fulva]|uniref:Vegetative incompatibility protein HET-E-1 n=1 Tax=Passalora fulva TaxID=5499 RepID=A0A9Q8P6Y6_PASFU|nr:Vegetative incompatibility protein HET-E-1 [Fulvia fulva]KAK4629244.1 Vegetative incompatibility protein HET-E-1 [Fulvia fulva]KAK4629942.1 Vegetative incompatibility protein HET-E-1 [Fulvia fulva]UJO15332.1 Vegetative incompatibility protein HET-E-1 [Fulvia fulva]WPV12626.1 Vegetative incompatibility protein HET-E-1 [Fulvia fulva]WPV27437.1 Vegetative incompatibility protein HET-E-1 [Fulvia fulva]
MWLLNAKTRELEQVMDDRLTINKYAILSHTWEDRQEVLFEEIGTPAAKSKAGHQKIEFTCKQAVRDNLDYVWVDTCCIDKRSSAELSEAINSMYRWYNNARKCYVYLADARLPNLSDDEKLGRIFQDCRWVKRGWTLQELIAPKYMAFYDRRWNYMGDKVSNAELLSRATGIDVKVLRDRDLLPHTSVAKRMSWAARRTTTRVEDEAYSLLGLFGVNMPLLYGEGRRSFQRLQEEIIRTQAGEDHSILAWRSTNGDLLAPSPASFGFASNMSSWSLPQGGTFELSNKGLRIGALVKPQEDGDEDDCMVMALECTASERRGTQQALALRRRPQVVHPTQVRAATVAKQAAIYDRLPTLQTITLDDMEEFEKQEITIGRTMFHFPRSPQVRITHSADLTTRHKRTMPTDSALCVPRGDWNAQTQILYLRPATRSFTAGYYACLELYKPGARQAHFPLAMKLDLSNPGVDSNASPKLYAEKFNALRHLDELQALVGEAKSLRSGDVRNIDVGDERMVQVIARYVMVAGEVMWNLHFSFSKTEIVDPVV